MDQAETKAMMAGTVVRFGVPAGQAPAAIGDEAKQRGRQTVLDVVSNNDGVELNSTNSFECMLATSSSTVSLKGRAAAAVQAQK